MKRIICFGTGGKAEQMILGIRSREEFYEDQIVAFSDSNPSKWGKIYYGYQIIPPTEIAEAAYDKIVISSSIYYDEIKDMLITKYAVEESDILYWEDYLVDVNITYQYNQSLKKSGKRKNKQSLNTSHTVVYTAVENDYDELQEPLYVGADIEYVCFTDNKNLKSNIWNIEYIQGPKDGNYAKDIRKYKFFPQNYFKEYQTSIWIDANIKVTKNLNEFVEKYSRGSSFLCFPHEMRKCIYEECGAVISLMKASPVDIIKQSADYLQKGYPANNGLYLGGFLVRNHHDEVLCKCMEDWWQEINRYTVRDQMSLPYVLWKNGLEPDLCDLNLYHNDYIQYIAHKMGHWRTAR